MIYIGFETQAEFTVAQQLATKFNFELDQNHLPRLQVCNNKLVLLAEKMAPMWVDLCSQTWQHRRDAGKKQGLVRACKPKAGMKIFDVTAGWGRDAAILASFGATVRMIERQPLMAALLQDGLLRATSESNSTMSLELIYADAKDYLANLSPTEYPDVIYIDPMHPTRQKSALVKKDMQLLQQLIGVDDDVNALIELSINRTLGRVVVKWPQNLPPLCKPIHSVPGKTVRFDIFTQ